MIFRRMYLLGKFVGRGSREFRRVKFFFKWLLTTLLASHMTKSFTKVNGFAVNQLIWKKVKL